MRKEHPSKRPRVPAPPRSVVSAEPAREHSAPAVEPRTVPAWYSAERRSSVQLTSNNALLIVLAQRGVPKADAVAVLQRISRTKADFSEAVIRFAPSLHTVGPRGVLPPKESDCLLRVARMIAVAEVTACVDESVASYFHRSDPALEDWMPFELCATAPGEELFLRVLSPMLELVHATP
jgi:uncharacterized protein (DUF2384 family)